MLLFDYHKKELQKEERICKHKQQVGILEPDVYRPFVVLFRKESGSECIRFSLVSYLLILFITHSHVFHIL